MCVCNKCSDITILICNNTYRTKENAAHNTFELPFIFTDNAPWPHHCDNITSQVMLDFILMKCFILFREVQQLSLQFHVIIMRDRWHYYIILVTHWLYYYYIHHMVTLRRLLWITNVNRYSLSLSQCCYQVLLHILYTASCISLWGCEMWCYSKMSDNKQLW